MSSSTPARPTFVTAFGWMVVIGSAFLVFSAFEQVASLSSLDSRRAVEEFLAEPPGDGLGLSVQTALDLLHVLSIVTGGCAAAAAVLGFYALRRHRAARVWLTVVVAPMFVAGMVLGGLLSALVTAGAAALWLQPARDWFNGIDKPGAPSGMPFTRGRGGQGRGGRGDRARDEQDGKPDEGGSGDGSPDGGGPDGGGPDGGEGERRPEDEHAQQRERQPAHQGAAPSGPGEGPEPTRPVRPMRDPVAGGGTGPRAYVGYGQPDAAPAEDAGDAGPAARPADQRSPDQPPAAHPGWQPGSQPGQQAAPSPGWAPPRPPRPTAVVVACVLTWAASAVVGLIMLGTVVALAASPDMLLDEVRGQNPEIGAEVSRSMLVGATIGMGGAVVVWCLAASVVGFFVLRGRAWARITLAVSATVAALGSAVLSIGSVAMLLPATAAGATAYLLLFRSDVRGWFRHA